MARGNVVVVHGVEYDSWRSCLFVRLNPITQLPVPEGRLRGQSSHPCIYRSQEQTRTVAIPSLQWAWWHPSSACPTVAFGSYTDHAGSPVAKARDLVIRGEDLRVNLAYVTPSGNVQPRTNAGRGSEQTRARRGQGQQAAVTSTTSQHRRSFLSESHLGNFPTVAWLRWAAEGRFFSLEEPMDAW